MSKPVNAQTADRIHIREKGSPKIICHLDINYPDKDINVAIHKLILKNAKPSLYNISNKNSYNNSPILINAFSGFL
jgi:hypothetical protein